MSGIRETLDEQNVKLEFVGTNEQAADIFTKALPPLKWAPAIAMLHLTPYGE